MENLIKKINQLSAISKTRELTIEEKEKQRKLREEYLKIFKGNFRNEMKKIKIVDEWIVNADLETIHEHLIEVKGIVSCEKHEDKTKIIYDSKMINKTEIKKLLDLKDVII